MSLAEIVKAVPVATMSAVRRYVAPATPSVAGAEMEIVPGGVVNGASGTRHATP